MHENFIFAHVAKKRFTFFEHKYNLQGAYLKIQQADRERTYKRFLVFSVKADKFKPEFRRLQTGGGVRGETPPFQLYEKIYLA
jgi:hypothetical protein